MARYVLAREARIEVRHLASMGAFGAIPALISSRSEPVALIDSTVDVPKHLHQTLS